MDGEPNAVDTGPGGIATAWLVHAFTASSAVFALLALNSVLDRDFRLALLWLGAALIVDGVDGTLARAAHVKTRTPRFDGAALDLIVDYLTYVFVPTVFIWRAGMLPEALAMPLAALIQLSALYHFCRTDMKSDDNYFRGFPALWNVVAFYLYVTEPGEEAAAAIVALLAASSFAPIHFVHPFRVRDYGILLPVVTALWAAAILALLWPGWNEDSRTALLWASVATGLVLIGMGLWRSIRGPRAAAREQEAPRG